jgi:hypothetical protein
MRGGDDSVTIVTNASSVRRGGQNDRSLPSWSPAESRATFLRTSSGVGGKPGKTTNRGAIVSFEMGRAGQETAARRVICLRRTYECGPLPADARARIATVEEGLREDVGESLSKAAAARILGISLTTLDKWVGRGLVATVGRPNGREEIEAASFYDLASEVEQLRELGEDKAVIAAALHRLAERDPEVQKMLSETLGEGLRAVREGRTHELVIPATFGPED